MSYGVTSAGFVAKPLDTAIIDFATRLATALGVALDSSAQSIIGQQAQLFMSEVAGPDSIWELAQQVYDSLDPDKALDAQLDNLCFFTGTIRKGATTSTASLLAVGLATTAIPSGSTATNAGVDITFATTADATLAATTAWATGVTLALDAVRSNSGHVYVCIAAGTTGGAGSGPTSTATYPTTITDGTVTWVYVGDGTGFANIPAQANATGPIAAPGFALSRIGTPISGWNAVTNPLDAVVGRAQESNSALRVRRTVELKGISTSVVEAIRAKLSALAGVTSVTVFENASDYTNADGMTPHTVEAMVTGSASDATLGTALYEVVAGGIGTMGAHSYTVTDEAGVSWPMQWSTPTVTDVYVQATIYADLSLFPSDGDTVASADILAFGNGLRVGNDVRPTAISGALFEDIASLPGLLGTNVIVSTSPISTDPLTLTVQTPLVIGSRSISAFDSTRIAVFVVGTAP